MQCTNAENCKIWLLRLQQCSIAISTVSQFSDLMTKLLLVIMITGSDCEHSKYKQHNLTFDTITVSHLISSQWKKTEVI